jgi:hypothetical protein
MKRFPLVSYTISSHVHSLVSWNASVFEAVRATRLHPGPSHPVPSAGREGGREGGCQGPRLGLGEVEGDLVSVIREVEGDMVSVLYLVSSKGKKGL